MVKPHLFPLQNISRSLIVGSLILAILLILTLLQTIVEILCIVVQTLESYLLTPFIQKQAVAIPPALLISVQGSWVLLYAV